MVLPILAGVGAALGIGGGAGAAAGAAGGAVLMTRLAAAMGLLPLINTAVKSIFAKGEDSEGLQQRVAVLRGHRDELAAGIMQRQGVDRATAQQQADQFINGVIQDEAPKYASQKPGAAEWITTVLEAGADLLLAHGISKLGAPAAAGAKTAGSGAGAAAAGGSGATAGMGAGTPPLPPMPPGMGPGAAAGGAPAAGMGQAMPSGGMPGGPGRALVAGAGDSAAVSSPVGGLPYAGAPGQPPALRPRGGAGPLGADAALKDVTEFNVRPGAELLEAAETAGPGMQPVRMSQGLPGVMGNLTYNPGADPRAGMASIDDAFRAEMQRYAPLLQDYPAKQRQARMNDLNRQQFLPYTLPEL